MPSMYDHPHLLADVGSRHVQFALEVAPGEFRHPLRLRCADFPELHLAVTRYLEWQPLGPVRHAAFAISTPVAGDQVRMTNYPWTFSIEALRECLGLEQLLVVNDFTALAMALPSLLPQEMRQVGGGNAQPRSVIGVLGAGSGLGVSGLIPAADGWIALGTEGGHASFAPSDERELVILQHAWRQYDHVSFERLLSGSGLQLIHRALAERHSVRVVDLEPQQITQAAIEGRDALCAETVDAFCRILGTAAANLAVTQGAFGGIFIGSGIVPRLGSTFDRSGFRQRFEDKGRFRDYMAQIPTFVVTTENATLAGAAIILNTHLQKTAVQGTGNGLLGQIQRARANLSPAERRVADHVIAHAHGTLNDPIARIALQARVSQPTVIRFCRTLGCDGLSDFKLRLAASLTNSMPITHTQVRGDDTMLELGVKVLSNTASSILQVRDQLNRDTIDKAAQLILTASRVEIHALGHSSIVADDAQFKFLRVGVPATAYTVPRLQELAVQLVDRSVLVVVVSVSGSVTELLDLVSQAQARGAPVLAITASQSALARKADLSLVIDPTEDPSVHLPMISRILLLLLIDILVVGVMMRRGGDALPQIGDQARQSADEPLPAPARRRARMTGPGVGQAGSLSGLTSHGQ